MLENGTLLDGELSKVGCSRRTLAGRLSHDLNRGEFGRNAACVVSIELSLKLKRVGESLSLESEQLNVLDIESKF
jgi:hypothetical protein